MNDAPTGSLLAGIEGMAGPEPWGRWSNAKEVVLRFKDPLPRQLNVVLVAQAYGPNDGQQFIARVGAAEQRFTIPTTASEVFLRFETDGKQDTLRIVVPQPASPESLGHSNDKRLLGVGLSSVEIGTLPN
jgi:phosphoglycerol transferase